MLPPQPPRVFSLRGLRLYFPALEPWVTRSALLPAVPPSLSVRECGATGSASGQTACPIGPTPRQSRSPVSVPPRPRESSQPRCPSPPLLLVWMYVSFLYTWCRTSSLFDFLSVLVVRGGAVCLPTPPSWFCYQIVFVLLSSKKGSWMLH